MTLREAGRITGYTVMRIPDERFTLVALSGQVEIVRVVARDEKTACVGLVAAVYKIHSEVVRKLQGYMCAHCGQRQPLSVHHRIFRSAGRRDDVENLIALCVDCHAREHGPKKNGGRYAAIQ